ncbi:MAG TPA: polysaccharide deacetylase family protein [Clostridiales bacterium]|nr:polysaccharide deacetylase family protein [Clostridiales bacterium]
MITSMYRGEELQEEDKANEKCHSNRLTTDSRRKRINRLKTAIIITIIIMMVLPTILCIFLGFRVFELQKDVKDLLDLHGQLEQSIKPAKSKEHYAYAAENTNSEDEDQEEVDTHISDPHNSVDDRDSSEDDIDNKDNVNLDDIDIQNSNTGDISDLSLVTSPDYIVSTNEQDILIVKDGIYNGKKVYLTFDDGPSIYTNDILDIMAEYNVKATFFVIGDTSKSAKKIYERIVNEGHAIGLHSYSHDYRGIYNSLEDFDKDFTKLWDLLYDTIGFRPMIFRFPGGSANRVHKHGMEEFIKYLKDKSVVYFDWNVLNEDATGIDYSVEELIDNIISDVKRKNRSIVLMHDASNKKTTVDSLSELIETLLEGGATLLPLDEDVMPIQQIEASSIE